VEFNRRTALAISTVGAATAGLSSLGVSSAGEAGAALVGPATETMLLTGCDADHTVDWDFQVTAGRRAGEWSRIPRIVDGYEKVLDLEERSLLDLLDETLDAMAGPRLKGAPRSSAAKPGDACRHKKPGASSSCRSGLFEAFHWSS
jgi:hypothetical protein